MAAQKGFEYEKYLYTTLTTFGIAAGNPPAGASSDRPDLEIKLVKDKENQKQGVELKLAPTAGGSLVMKYIKGKWVFDPKSADEKEKAFMVEVAKKANLLREMNTSGAYGTKWRGKIPFLQNNQQGKKVLVESVKNMREAYEKDIKQFGGQNEIKIPVAARVMCDYYNLKDTHYLNVASHGFFLMNKKDPLNLNKEIKGPLIPDFANSARLQIRVRCQYKGSGDYQFTMTLEFGGVKTSPYNIGPILSKDNVQIDKRALLADANKPLLDKFGYKAK